jgi:hypothetical protein
LLPLLQVVRMGENMLMQPGEEASKTISKTLKESEPKLFTLITSNKNGREFNNNLETITCATNAQFPK